MSDLLTQIRENLTFVIFSGLIIGVLSLAAQLSQRLFKIGRQVSSARKVSIIGISAAIAAALQLMDFPVPFLAPGFY